MHDSMAEIPEAATASGGIPLNLAPLLSSYSRQHRRLAIAVERLPPQARLSRGRNNGDSTWSLKPEELDGLAYLPPDGTNESPVLTIRIISLDGDGAATLAQLDFAVPSGESAPARSPDGDAPPPGLAEAAASADAHAATAEASLAEELERRLEDLRATAEREIEGRIAAAVQEAVQKSEARASARLRQARKGWQRTARRELEQARARARAEAVRDAGDDTALAQLRAELAQVRETLATREGELSQANARFEEARGLWREEARAALSQAQEAWNAGEAERLAAAEAHWRAQSDRMLAEATARCERAEVALSEARARAGAVRDAGDDTALAQLREELAQVRETLATREGELSQANARFEEARGLWREEARAALSQAQEAWNAGEAERLAAAEAHWRAQSDRMLAEATARCERAEAALSEARAAGDDPELLRRCDEVTALEAALASRESELEQAKSTLAESRVLWQMEALSALQKAEEAWKAGETERLAAARRDWQKNARAAKTRGGIRRAIRGQRWALAGGRLLRLAMIVACLAAVVLFYPRVEPVMLERWWPKIIGLTDAVDPWLRRAGDTIRSWLPNSTAGGGLTAVVSVRGANVRAGPSRTAAVIAVLPPDAMLMPLERRGDWVLVRTGGGTRGWVHGSLLRDLSPR